MSVVKSVSFDEIMARGSIKDTDVLKVRRAFYEDGQISAAEAQSLFDLNAACPAQCPAWATCFVEMLTDYVVNQAVPEGYVTAENADWLLERVVKDGRIVGKAEFELLIAVLEKSRWSPQRLVVAALTELKDAIVTGKGPIRDDRDTPPGLVSESDVELMRRVLYAFGGDGNVSITRVEAELLFAINDATVGAENADGWRDLFVKAIANCVLSTSGYQVPCREQALAREAWLDRRGDLSLGNIAAGLGRGLAGIVEAYREQSPEERAIARLERQKIEIVTAEEITPAEAGWLAERIGRDGCITPNELALVEFLKAESWKIAPELQTLLERTPAAA